MAEACAQEQRDAAGRAPLVLSAAQTITVGETDVQARRRAEAIGEQPPLFGTPDQVVEQIGRFAEIGVSRLFLQIRDLYDLAHLDLIAERVAPQLLP